jgi:ComF family protein
MLSAAYKKLFSVSHALWQGALFFFYPFYCYGCRDQILLHAGLCDSCERELRPVASVECCLTATKKIPVYAAYAYKGPICTMIRMKKCFDTHAAVALAQMTDELMEHLVDRVDLFVSIPLHKKRLAERGFNQTEVMSAYLAQRWQKEHLSPLIRTKQTVYQSSLSALDRQKNVAGAFEWASAQMPFEVMGKHICIVDDLYTTGSTVREVALMLQQARPASISVLVAARAIEE